MAVFNGCMSLPISSGFCGRDFRSEPVWGVRHCLDRSTEFLRFRSELSPLKAYPRSTEYSGRPTPLQRVPATHPIGAGDRPPPFFGLSGAASRARYLRGSKLRIPTLFFIWNSKKNLKILNWVRGPLGSRLITKWLSMLFYVLLPGEADSEGI